LAWFRPFNSVFIPIQPVVVKLWNKNQGRAGVKAGRKVTLYLSKGAILDKVGEYVTRNLEQVREELQTLFGAQNPIIEIDTITYAFDESPIGTILSQDPTPGTQLSHNTKLNLLLVRVKMRFSKKFLS